LLKEVSGVATVHRVNVNFSQSAYKTLEELSERKNKSMSDILRDAIALEKWFDDTYRDGGKFLVERDGEVREVIPRAS
jgi:restriction endonuclease